MRRTARHSPVCAAPIRGTFATLDHRDGLRFTASDALCSTSVHAGAEQGHADGSRGPRAGRFVAAAVVVGTVQVVLEHHGTATASMCRVALALLTCWCDLLGLRTAWRAVPRSIVTGSRQSARVAAIVGGGRADRLVHPAPMLWRRPWVDDGPSGAVACALEDEGGGEAAVAVAVIAGARTRPMSRGPPAPIVSVVAGAAHIFDAASQRDVADVRPYKSADQVLAIGRRRERPSRTVGTAQRRTGATCSSRQP